jgi:hypothetical protein
MENKPKSKTNTERLKELQDLADEHEKIKAEIEVLLNILDEIEIKHNNLVKEIKEN